MYVLPGERLQVGANDLGDKITKRASDKNFEIILKNWCKRFRR